MRLDSICKTFYGPSNETERNRSLSSDRKFDRSIESGRLLERPAFLRKEDDIHHGKVKKIQVMKLTTVLYMRHVQFVDKQNYK